MLNNPKKIELVTADGAPLKLSLAKAQRRSKVVAFLMVSPLLIFMVFAFLVPIADMLLLSVDNSIVEKILPKSVASLKNWDPYSNELPEEAVFAAMVDDIKDSRTMDLLKFLFFN